MLLKFFIILIFLFLYNLSFINSSSLLFSLSSSIISSSNSIESTSITTSTLNSSSNTCISNMSQVVDLSKNLRIIESLLLVLRNEKSDKIQFVNASRRLMNLIW